MKGKGKEQQRHQLWGKLQYGKRYKDAEQEKIECEVVLLWVYLVFVHGKAHLYTYGIDDKHGQEPIDEIDVMENVGEAVNQCCEDAGIVPDVSVDPEAILDLAADDIVDDVCSGDWKLYPDQRYG